ncbi:MAG: AtpZ/AtpI family protein [Oscillospiraceae bacterium]|nr:AtpZ/AtpI family protein [Oscillospiraceae bacterium]
MKKNENPFSVYAKVSQFAFVIITPLLVFLWGGSALVRHFDLPQWVMGICVALAIVFMLSGAVNYLFTLIKHYENQDKDKKAPKAFTSAPRDNDYYDDYQNLRK